MDIDLVLDEIKAALRKVVKGGVTRSQIELDNFKITVYKVGSIIRIDIKETLNS